MHSGDQLILPSKKREKEGKRRARGESKSAKPFSSRRHSGHHHRSRKHSPLEASDGELYDWQISASDPELAEGPLSPRSYAMRRLHLIPGHLGPVGLPLPAKAAAAASTKAEKRELSFPFPPSNVPLLTGRTPGSLPMLPAPPSAASSALQVVAGLADSAMMQGDGGDGSVQAVLEHVPTFDVSDCCGSRLWGRVVPC